MVEKKETKLRDNNYKSKKWIKTKTELHSFCSKKIEEFLDMNPKILIFTFDVKSTIWLIFNIKDSYSYSYFIYCYIKYMGFDFVYIVTIIIY